MDGSVEHGTPNDRHPVPSQGESHFLPKTAWWPRKQIQIWSSVFVLMPWCFLFITFHHCIKKDTPNKTLISAYLHHAEAPFLRHILCVSSWKQLFLLCPFRGVAWCWIWASWLHVAELGFEFVALVWHCWLLCEKDGWFVSCRNLFFVRIQCSKWWSHRWKIFFEIFWVQRLRLGFLLGACYGRNIMWIICQKWSPQKKALVKSKNTQGVLALITSLLHDPHDDKFSLHSALSRIEVADVLWWEMKGEMKGGNNGSFIHGRVVEEKMGKIRGMLSVNYEAEREMRENDGTYIEF